MLLDMSGSISAVSGSVFGGVSTIVRAARLFLQSFNKAHSFGEMEMQAATIGSISIAREPAVDRVPSADSGAQMATISNVTNHVTRKIPIFAKMPRIFLIISILSMSPFYDSNLCILRFGENAIFARMGVTPLAVVKNTIPLPNYRGHNSTRLCG